MAKTIQQVLGSKNLCGLIRGVVSGVPADAMPAGMLTATRGVSGNQATYMKVNGTRETARLVQYGSPSLKRGLQGISEIPVTLLHTFEHTFHKAADYLNLMAEDNESRQSMGRQTIARQVGEFGRLFGNLRISTAMSALSRGAIYFDGDGNLLPDSTGAVTTVDFGVPAGNQDDLDVLGEGEILNASWGTAATDIIGQITNLQDAAVKLTGYPLVHAFYGSAIPGYLLGNTAIRALIAASPMLAQEAIKGTIPQGLLDLQWHKASQAFYVDADGVVRTWFAPEQITFTPAVSPEWWEVIEGTTPIPNQVRISNNATDALGDISEAQGAFSYAELTTDPVGIKHLAGDTFLPVVKVPGAIMLATVPTA